MMADDKTMNMNNIDALIAQLCPDGAEFRDLGEVAEIGTGNNNRVDSTDDGLFPFYVRSKEIYKIKTFAFDEEAIIIPGEGGVGEIFHYINGKYGLHQRAYRIHLLINDISTKFIYYYMMSNFKKFILQKAVNATVSSIRKPMIEKFPIPIPPIAIQQEIVNILDKFTQLQAELQTELQARRAQYEYYRNELLDFEGKEVEWKTLRDLCIVSSGGTPSKAEKSYWTNGTIPWLKSEVCKEKSVFLANDYITELGLKKSGAKLFFQNTTLMALVGATKCKTAFLEFEATTNQNIAGIKSKDENLLLDKFVFYYLTNLYKELIKNLGQYDMLNLGQIKEYKIPIPPLAEQNRIVAILDKFDNLVNGDSGSKAGMTGAEAGMTGSLPEEIQARRKQYEYYRRKLLEFKPLAQ